MNREFVIWYRDDDSEDWALFGEVKLLHLTKLDILKYVSREFEIDLDDWNLEEAEFSGHKDGTSMLSGISPHGTRYVMVIQ